MPTPLSVASSIPSPGRGVWELGPLPIRAYALCIIAGIVVAIWMGEKRWVARGGQPGDITDLAVWAVPFGLIGGRLYHVLTDSELYFGGDRSAWEALYIWQGGLGVWGAVALGAVGVIVGARVKGIKVLPVMDAMAPGVLVAQAIGRWGNWFNQELYGRPTNLPWGLEIDPDHYPTDQTFPADTLFHPTFLYESLWALAGAAFLILAERHFRLGHGRVVALYVMVYTLGRGWIEMLRIDSVQLNDVLGLRFNVWTSIVLFLAAAVYLVTTARGRSGRENAVDVAAPTTASQQSGSTSENAAGRGT